MSITGRSSHATVAAIATLIVAACGDPTTAPVGRTTPAFVTSQAPPRIPNSIRYRDTGHRPAKGRAGSATLTVSALLGRGGATDVVVEAGSVTGTGQPMLAKVQLAGYAPGGEHLFTMNDNALSAATASFALAGLSRNGHLRIHANVRGVDGARTNVIVVEDAVKLRPDIAVTGLQVPSEVWTKTPTIVSAGLHELNGDVGARATCLLEVDGIPVDSATDVWVDAGGTVSCDFAVMLSEIGTHSLTVRATGVTPGDWDAANNSASATVKVGRDMPLSYSATVSDDSSAGSMIWSEYFTNFAGYRWDRRGTVTWAGRSQSASITAFTREVLDFPEEPLNNVRVSQRTGGATVSAASYDELPADRITSGANWLEGCVVRSSGEIVVILTVCTRRETYDGVTSSYTSLSHRWNVGDVTYHSIGSDNLSCGPPPEPDCVPHSYTWNTTIPGDDRRVLLGSEYAFEVEIWSGLTRFRVAPTLALTSAYTDQRVARTCRDQFIYHPIARRPGQLTTCSESREEHWTLTGNGSGPGP